MAVGGERRARRERRVVRPHRALDTAVALILLSGGLMTWAGYVLARGNAAAALWITLPPALAIEAAFALVRRADRSAGRPRSSRIARLRQETVVLVAGGIMMVAGYAAAAWSWVLAPPLIVLGGFVAGGGLANDDLERKRHLVRGAEKYVANPPTRAALLLGLPLPLVLLETTGRHSGKRRRTPVMNGIVDNDLWIVAEHGERAGYVRNLLANPRVRIKRGRHWLDGTATVVDNDDPFDRAAWIAEQRHRSKKLEFLATRLFCADPITVRVELGPAMSTSSTAPPVGLDREH